MRRVLWHALIIVSASVTLGLIANAVRFDKNRDGNPHRLPWVTPPKTGLAAADKISFDEAKRLWNEGAAFFLDARAPTDFQAGHIAHAYNLPAEEFTKHYSEVAGLLTPESTIVAYCDGTECDLSQELMHRLRELGYQHVHVLENGWTTWRTAGLPIESGAKNQ